MRFNIHYHTIRGAAYDDYDYRGKLFNKFEDDGYVGLTTSETSPWELREIRRWIKKQKQYVYMDKNEVFYTTDEDGYMDNNNCYWFVSEEQKNEFIKLLDGFPKRSYEVEFKTGDEEHYNVVWEDFRKQQYKNNCRFVERDEDYYSSGEAIIQFANQADAMVFKLKWT